jgi:single-stranded-DNA-specific exonuclease
VHDPVWDLPRERAPRRLIDDFPNLPPLVVHLAAWRLRALGGSPDDGDSTSAAWPDAAALQDFLYPAPTATLPPCEISRLAEAAARLKLAVARGEIVGIHGDYDVDGVTSAALLTTWLTGLGLRVETVLPNRLIDGYGLSVRALEDLAARGCRLVVVVDCGITAVAEAQRARQLGVELIVLDHHAPGPVIPDVELLVDPKLPGADVADRCLAAVGLAYRLCEAMAQAGVGDLPALNQLLDLVALGTIADVSPLTGQNRVLVSRGLDVLRHSRRPGVTALASTARISLARLSAEDVGFRLAPRLNAAGRLGDPKPAYELLMTVDPGRAAVLASELDRLNRQRQSLTEDALAAALAQLGNVNGTPKLLMATGTDWHLGIVGLVAGKLAERYHRPAIALTTTAQGYVGSARSIEGFDIAAALNACHDLLLKVGGHSRAAGLSLEEASLAPLRDRLLALADEQISADQMRAHLTADARVLLKTLTPDLLHAIERLGPFGEGNRPPLLQAEGLEIAAVNRVGNERQHVQLRFRQEHIVQKAVQFNAEPTAIPVVGSHVDVLFAPQLDLFDGAERVELRVVAMRAAR